MCSAHVRAHTHVQPPLKNPGQPGGGVLLVGCLWARSLSFSVVGEGLSKGAESSLGWAFTVWAVANLG